MFRGIVKFRARIVEADKGLTLPLFDFNPNEQGIEKVEIEGPNGNEILTAVYLTSVATPEAGIAIATKVHMAAMDRISFYHDIAIENGPVTGKQFSSTDTPPVGQYRITPGTDDLNMYGDAVKSALGLSNAVLKTELEQAAPPGERNFSLFRSALQSTGSVEKFMQLYSLLLMFFDDDQQGAQRKVDAFIRKEQPGVALTPVPVRRGVDETVYTRLRNELAHNRKGVNLDHTKAEMKEHLGGLISLTKRAIKLLS